MWWHGLLLGWHGLLLQRLRLWHSRLGLLRGIGRHHGRRHALRHDRRHLIRQVLRWLLLLRRQLPFARHRTKLLLGWGWLLLRRWRLWRLLRLLLLLHAKSGILIQQKLIGRRQIGHLFFQFLDAFPQQPIFRFQQRHFLLGRSPRRRPRAVRRRRDHELMPVRGRRRQGREQRRLTAGGRVDRFEIVLRG